MKINSDDLLKWMDEQSYMYAYDGKTKRKFTISLSGEYRVIHGQEIVYEGISMMTAIENFNAIETAPIKSEQPKLDN